MVRYVLFIYMELLRKYLIFTEKTDVRGMILQHAVLLMENGHPIFLSLLMVENTVCDHLFCQQITDLIVARLTVKVTAITR